MNANTFQIPKGYEDFVTSSQDLLKEFETYQDMESNDEVVYSLFLRKYTEIRSQNEFDIAITEVLSLRDKIMTLLKVELESYVWFYESFRLTPIIQIDKRQRMRLFLKGSTKVGENIEDEWFIVYLFLKLSKTFTGCSVQLHDKDGQFMLIEAADYLEDWLSPETSQNRVWIQNGAVHIIPNYLLESRDLYEGIDLINALSCLENKPEETKANHHIQSLINQRTTLLYPQRIYALEHYSLCIVPKWVASLLASDPSILPIAVNTFTTTATNDVSSLISKFSLQNLFQNEKSSPQKDDDSTAKDYDLDENCLQLISLRFSRILYAKCLFRKFKTPRKYHNWMRRISLSNSSKVMKAFDLGCRIVAGLEITLLQELQSLKSGKNNPDVLRKQLQQKNHTKLIESFQKRQISPKNGIMLNELDLVVDEFFAESQLFLHQETKLLKRVQFILSNQSDMTLNTQYCSSNSETDSILFEPFLKKNMEGSDHPLLKNDNEDWMYLKPEEFDKEMEQRMKQVPLSSMNNIDPSPSSTVPAPSQEKEKPSNSSENIKSPSVPAENLQEMVNEFKQFLNEKSDFEGISTSKEKKSSRKGKESMKKMTEEKTSPSNTQKPVTASKLSEDTTDTTPLRGLDNLDMNLIQSLLAKASIAPKEEQSSVVPPSPPSEEAKENLVITNSLVQGIAEKLIPSSATEETNHIDEIDSDDEVPGGADMKMEKASQDSDDEDDAGDEDEDDEDDEDDDESFDSDDLDDMDAIDEQDEEEEIEDNELSIEDYQRAMDQELSGIPFFQSNMKFSEFLKETRQNKGEEEEDDQDEGDDEDGEEYDGEEDVDFNFLMNMMQAQVEGMGVPSGPFQQILQQLGVMMDSPIDHQEK